MAMAIECELKEINMGESYAILTRINRAKFIEKISVKELSHEVTKLLAERIADALWINLEPKIIALIMDKNK